jgi:excisionase family DNA binding protein
MDPGALNKKSAAAYLGIGLRTLDRLIARGELPTIWLGRRLIIRRDTLDELLKTREQREGG